MNESTKSLIRHILTALGTILTLLGLNQFTGVVDFMLESFDGVWGAIELLVGFVIALIGFFQDRGERFEVRGDNP